MYLTDTHTHLYSEAFDGDREEMIARAMAAGVERFMVPAIDSTYTARMNELKTSYPDRMHLMAGLHPTHVKQETIKEELEHVEDQLRTTTFCAVGEIGIDLYWETATLELQRGAFARQIQWAKEHDLPIVIHCREAFNEVFDVLETENDSRLRGVFHCFTGNLAQAKKAISYGMKLGIGGVVTFKNGKLDTFLNEIDLRHIVLETDAPYLAPSPFRGKRNESSYVLHIAKKVAEVYGLPIDTVIETTTQNANSIFNLE